MIPVAAGAELARGAKAVGGWLLRHWWVMPLVGLAIALHLTRGTLEKRTAQRDAAIAGRTADRQAAAAEKAKTEARWQGQLATATTSYADRLAAREPIILRSTDTVREYAATPAGALRCRDADRVLRIDQLDRDLFGGPPAGAASRGAGAVHPDSAAPPG